MNQENKNFDLIFLVDKKLVLKSITFWLGATISVFLLLWNDFNIFKTILEFDFWKYVTLILFAGILFIFWEIRDGKVQFLGNQINFMNDFTRKNVDLNEINKIINAKTVYGRCIGLEYKIPHGLIARETVQYNFFSKETLSQIIEHILKINPQIELDETVQKMLEKKFDY